MQDVYEPAEDTFLAAEHLFEILGKKTGLSLSILDMGCGTGLLGLIAASNSKAGEVFFCDVNDAAVKLSKKNYEMNRSRLKATCTFICTDLFAKIPNHKKFDLLIFNTPYLPNESTISSPSPVNNALDGGENGVEVAENFLSQSVSHIKAGGEVLLVSSSFANLGRLVVRTSDLGYKILEERKKHMFFEDMVSIHMRKSSKL